MNENNEFLQPIRKKNPCLTCLNPNMKLYPMSNDFINEYTKFVDTMKEESMLICKPCCWMFKRFLRFKKQCRTAKAFLEDKDSKSFIFTQRLTSAYNLNLSQTEVHSYPISFQDETQEKPKNSVMISNDPVNISTDPVMISNDPVNISNYSMIISNDPVMISNDDSIDNYDEDHNNEDLPLVLLKRNKKSKRKKIQRESIEDQPTHFNKANGKIKKAERDTNTSNGKSEKARELRAGFSSRMVQETQEYLVIKLTKEQVLSEMADRAKTEEFQRFPFKCEQCVKGFNFKDVLTTHMGKHSVEHGSFQCDLCHQYCPSAVSLRGHIKSHTTSKRTVMQRHVRRHGTSEACACEQCGKLFKTIDSLRVHAIRHDVSSRLQCGECSRTFVYASLLRRHSRSVHQRRDYYCVECDTQFKSPESLRLHFKKAVRHRDISTYKHACSECPQRMFSASALAAHRASCHAAAKAHGCALCRRRYSSGDALRAHIYRTHKQQQADTFVGEKD